MISRCTLLAFAATIVPLAAAHGHMFSVTIDDNQPRIFGPDPNSDASGTFSIRQINDIDPVKGANNPDMFCGHGSTPASGVANATQGSVLKFSWRNGENGTWVHKVGPVMTYMASCGSGGCANLTDSNNAEFFKINQLGKKADGITWEMADLTVDLDATTSATIPSNLPDGEYLVRHELIAMHNGNQEGGVEFFPACLQVRLTGGSSPSPLPSGNQVVTFPGAYRDNETSLFDPNFFDNATAVYEFPGPQPVTQSTVVNARSRIMRDV